MPIFHLLAYRKVQLYAICTKLFGQEDGKSKIFYLYMEAWEEKDFVVSDDLSELNICFYRKEHWPPLTLSYRCSSV